MTAHNPRNELLADSKLGGDLALRPIAPGYRLADCLISLFSVGSHSLASLGLFNDGVGRRPLDLEVGTSTGDEVQTVGIGSGHSGEITVEANDQSVPDYAEKVTVGFTDCGHDDYRPGIVLDPFAGSGTTLSVATGHGHDAIGIDLDARNLELARQRVGFFLDEGETQ